nr:E3 ubiquitin-protein ligase COP1-like isoform X2 [Tanacetum cinerariifolium]
MNSGGRRMNPMGDSESYCRLRVIAELRHGELYHSANIVSSIEFDHDDENFATAGVSRRINVFNFLTIVNEPPEAHCPAVEISTRLKLSFLSWNKHTKNHIASSDYEGTVFVWDVNTRQSTKNMKNRSGVLIIYAKNGQCLYRVVMTVRWETRSSCNLKIAISVFDIGRPRFFSIVKILVISYVNDAIDTTAIGFKRRTLANSLAFVRPSRTPTSAGLVSALNIETLVAATKRRETPIECIHFWNVAGALHRPKGMRLVMKWSSQDERNFAIFFHFENNKIGRKGLRVLRDSLVYNEHDIWLMLAPKSDKALQEKVLLKLHGIRKLPGSRSFGGTLVWIIV